MPNHIKNKLTFEGLKKDIDQLIKKYSTHHDAKESLAHDGQVIYKKSTGDGEYDYEYGWLNKETGMFHRRNKEQSKGIPDGFEVEIDPAWTRFPDFNKIIPMPDSLHMEAHTGIIDSVKSALQMGVHENALIGGLERLNRDRQKSALTFSDTEWDMFIQGLNNARKYGHVYWYDWATENWGTKWNSYSCKQEDGYVFETAWTNVIGLMKMISKEFSGVRVHYSWADEDTGSNTGEVVIMGGEVVSENIPKKGSKEACDIAFKLRPHYKEYYELVDGNYQYAEDEE